ncbi:MAG TPA: flagellar export chaperone FliS [Dissulfurispiraceae bacterium]|nr:flagellar export chaperone FliS [Dissulfurispiraceae bacterium]
MVNTAYALNSYTQAKVLGGSPVEMIIMLYDGVIEYLNKAATGTAMRNLQVKLKYIDRTLAIIKELNRSLNMDAGGEVAVNLRNLYTHMMVELVLANARNDSDKMLHICGLLKNLREGWIEARNKV